MRVQRLSLQPQDESGRDVLPAVLPPSRQMRSRKADVTLNSQVLAIIALLAMLLHVAVVVRACGTRSFDDRMVLPM